MANCILVAPTATHTRTPQYQLDPQARRAILAQAPSAQKRAETDRQRTAFEALNAGCAFGQQIQQNTASQAC